MLIVQALADSAPIGALVRLWSRTMQGLLPGATFYNPTFSLTWNSVAYTLILHLAPCTCLAGTGVHPHGPGISIRYPRIVHFENCTLISMFYLHDIRQLIFLENRQRRFVCQAPACFVIERRLGCLRGHTEKFHQRNIIGAGIGTLTARHARC